MTEASVDTLGPAQLRLTTRGALAHAMPRPANSFALKSDDRLTADLEEPRRHVR